MFVWLVYVLIEPGDVGILVLSHSRQGDAETAVHQQATSTDAAGGQ